MRFYGANLLLPVANFGDALNMTYLRAPWIISNFIADLGFSAKVHLSKKNILKNFNYFFEKSRSNYLSCELSSEKVERRIFCCWKFENFLEKYLYFENFVFFVWFFRYFGFFLEKYLCFENFDFFASDPTQSKIWKITKKINIFKT